MNRQQIEFGFSGMNDENISKMPVLICSEFTNYFYKFNISDYSNNYKELCFIHMAIDPNTHSFRPDKKILRRKQNRFDMYLNVPDYKKFRTATKPEACKIIAKLYLVGIKKYLSKEKDFNHELFYKDVKKLFIDNGILTAK